MGVRGLTTYVNSNQELFLKYHLLHDAPLVIDGHSLCAQLYRSSNCFPAFGGDYDKFAACVRRFFKNLKKCNVISYVLFDGSYENRKLKTAYSRLRSKIKGASRLDPVTQSSLQIFPLLLRDVFIEVLAEMKIPYTVCEYEADDEIAAMARQLNCPVLSYDSDFFIYNVLYIPFNTLENKMVVIDDDQSKIYALECKIYKVKNLVDNFGGLAEEMLPLFATLLGNDYVQKRMFKKFFSQLKLPKGKTKKNEQQRSIHGLLKWLQNESLDSAIAKIIGRMKKTEKRKLYKIIKNGIDAYNRKHCRSLKYFNLSANFSDEAVFQIPEDDVQDNESLSDNDGDEDESSENDESGVGSSDELDEEHITDGSVIGLPEWFAEKIRQHSVPMTYINLYTLHLHFSCPQAEDYNDDEAFLCVLNILRLAFDILTDFSHEYCLYISREKDNDYKRVYVGKEYSMTRPFEKNFNILTDEDLRIYFTHFLREHFLELDLCHIDSLPSNFRLVMISILWWVKHCNVPPSFIHSLFISFIMLDVIDEKTGNFRGQFYFNNKHSNKLSELKKRPFITTERSEMLLNKNKVLYEDCLVAATILLEHFEISPDIKKRPKTYNIKKIHKFAQFQCCLHQFNLLSTLCGKKFENTVYSKFYNGTFLYNVASILEKHKDSQSFIEQYLKGANTVIMYFNSLCSVFKSCADQLGLVCSVNNNGVKKKTRRRKKSEKTISFLTDYFESEVII